MFSNANACVKGEGVLVLATVKSWSDGVIPRWPHAPKELEEEGW